MGREILKKFAKKFFKIEIPVSKEELEQEMNEYTPEMYRNKQYKSYIAVTLIIFVCMFVSGIRGHFIYPEFIFMAAGLWLIGLIGLGMLFGSLLYHQGESFEKSYKEYLKRQIRRRKPSQSVSVGII